MSEFLQPGEKLVPLGTVILQSMPLSEEEGRIWLEMIAKTLPSEIFTHYSWVPILPDIN